MEDIIESDYYQAKRDCKDFELKKFGEYLDLSLKSDNYYWLMFLKTFEKCV